MDSKKIHSPYYERKCRDRLEHHRGLKAQLAANIGAIIAEASKLPVKSQKAGQTFTLPEYIKSEGAKSPRKIAEATSEFIRMSENERLFMSGDAPDSVAALINGAEPNVNCNMRLDEDGTINFFPFNGKYSTIGPSYLPLLLDDLKSWGDAVPRNPSDRAFHDPCGCLRRKKWQEDICQKRAWLRSQISDIKKVAERDKWLQWLIGCTDTTDIFYQWRNWILDPIDRPGVHVHDPTAPIWEPWSTSNPVPKNMVPTNGKGEPCEGFQHFSKADFPTADFHTAAFPTSSAVGEAKSIELQDKFHMSNNLTINKMKTNSANVRLFQSFVNNRKNTIPILDFVKVQSGMATITNLETWVQFPIEAEDGFYRILNNQLFKVHGPDHFEAEEYPYLPVMVPASRAVFEGSYLLKFATCAAKDELRPVYSSIYINGSTNTIVATDTHLVRWETLFTFDIEKNFEALIPPVAPLLAKCRVDPSHPIQVTLLKDLEPAPGEQVQDKPDVPVFRYATFEFPDCLFTIRLVEGRFPNYKSVIPQCYQSATSGEVEQPPVRYFTLPLATVLEIDKTAKSFKRELLRISENGMVIENDETNLYKSWPAPIFCSRPLRQPDAIVMPMLVNDTPETEGGGPICPTLLGINAHFLPRLATMFKGNITIGVSDPNLAVAVWLEPSDNETIEVANKGVKAVRPKPATVTFAKPSGNGKRQIGPKYTIVHYSEKAIALFGDTKAIKEHLRTLGGRFNPRLQHNSQRTAGWVFPLKYENDLLKLIAS